MSVKPLRYRNNQFLPRGPDLHVLTSFDSNLKYGGSGPAGLSPSLGSPSSTSSIVGVANIEFPTGKVIPVQLHSSSRVSDLIQHLIDTRRSELGDDPEDYLIWEVISPNGSGNSVSPVATSDHCIRRPLRNTELLDNIVATWSLATHMYTLQLEESAVRLDTRSLAFLSPRRDIMRDPKFSGTAHWSQGYGSHLHWKKVYIELKSGGILNIYKTGSFMSSNSSSSNPGPSSSKLLRSLKISDYDVYSGQSGPHANTLTFRSQLSPDCFVDSSDAFHSVSCESYQDYDVLRNIIYTLRSKVVEKLARQTLSANVRENISPQLRHQSSMTTPTQISPLINSSRKFEGSSPTNPIGVGLNGSNQLDSNPSFAFTADSLLARATAQQHLYKQQQQQQQQQLHPPPTVRSKPSLSQIRKNNPFTPNSLLAKPVLPLSNTNLAAGMIANSPPRQQMPPGLNEDHSKPRGLIATAYRSSRTK